MDVIELNKKCLEAKAYIDFFDDGTDKSELWDEILDGRKNYPDFSEFMNFVGNGFTLGIGSYEFATKNDKKEYFNRVSTLVASYGVTRDFLEKIKEPIFGTPEFYEYDGDLIFSSNYLRNIVNAFNIYNRFKGKKDLVILEIGGGSGVLASILHQVIDIKHYILIDLPENLYLSSVYLQMTLGCNATYVSEKTEGYQHVIASLPSQMHYINLELDLVINTNSFGEMPADVLNSYLKYARHWLKGDGMLYSHNRIYTDHNIRGPKALSDYLCDGLMIDALDQSPSNTYFNFHLHHIMFLKRGIERVPSKYVNVLGELIHCGLFDYIRESSNNLLKGDVDIKEQMFFDKLNDIYMEEDFSAKLDLLNKLDFSDDNYKIIILYYKIAIQFLDNNFNSSQYEEFIRLNKGALANNYAAIFVTLLAIKSGYPIKERFYNELKGSKVSHYYQDIIEHLDGNGKANMRNVSKRILFLFSSQLRNRAIKGFIKSRLFH